MGYPCITYIRPYGEKVDTIINHIYEEDEKWFGEHNVKLSMEQVGDNNYAIYADIGLMEEDDETPRELIVLSYGRSCEDSLKELRKQCEEELKNA